MRRSLLVTVILTLGTSVGLSTSAPTDRALPCDPADPETCLYEPEVRYEVDVLEGGELTDPGRGDHPIPLIVRYPRLDAPELRPVVIWNHGGNPSLRGAERSEEWGNALAAVGYVVIHPARVPIVDPTPHRADCAASMIVEPEECGYWMANFRYGPQTTHFLLDHLADVEDLDPALAGLLDASRVVIAGHSAGSTVPLANAGAWQQWDPLGMRYDESDPRPIAFLATGVQGPMYAGFGSGFQSPGSDRLFDEHSYAGIDRPFMSITGVGDETGEPPETRLTGWLTSVGDGDNLLLWDTEREAVHETMDVDKCDTPLRADHCRWITAAGVAFLDAAVQQRPEARDWLASGAVAVLTGGAIELHRR